MLGEQGDAFINFCFALWKPSDFYEKIAAIVCGIVPYFELQNETDLF